MSRKGFTLIELLVVIAIIAILAAILFPVFAKAREKARQASCMSNHKQMGLAFFMYNSDYDELYVTNPQWKSKLQPYIKNTQINHCPSRLRMPWDPSQEMPWYYGQGFNCGVPAGRGSAVVAGFVGRSEAQIESPASKILVAEWDRCNAGPPCGTPGLFDGGATCYWACTTVHNGGANVLFGDGHVKWLKPSTYHSTMESADASGNPVPATAEPVAESVWREYLGHDLLMPEEHALMAAQRSDRTEPTVAEEVARARELSLGGLFIALGVVIPIAFHAFGGGKLGSVLLPMYLPVLACAMLVSAPIAAAVGLLTPVLSSALTGMPPIMPFLPMMVAELVVMATLASLLRRRLRLHPVLAVVLALLSGRVVLGLVAALLMTALPAGMREGLPEIMRTPLAYVAAATVTALPGLALQIVAVPAAVALVERRRHIPSGD